MARAGSCGRGINVVDGHPLRQGFLDSAIFAVSAHFTSDWNQPARQGEPSTNAVGTREPLCMQKLSQTVQCDRYCEHQPDAPICVTLVVQILFLRVNLDIV